MVNPLPTNELNPSYEICDGDILTLNAENSGSTYLWNDNSTDQTLEVTTAGTYSVTVTNADGCESEDEVVITENALPNVSAGQDKTMCVYHSPTQLTGTPSGGTFSGNGVNGNEFNPAQAGEGDHVITYTYTHVNGCENSDVATITVDGCVGLSENILNSISISPNPASNYVNINLNEGNKIESIYIISFEGKVVQSMTQIENTKNVSIDLSSIAMGTYLIKVVTELGEITKKIIVK